MQFKLCKLCVRERAYVFVCVFLMPLAAWVGWTTQYMRISNGKYWYATVHTVLCVCRCMVGYIVYILLNTILAELSVRFVLFELLNLRYFGYFFPSGGWGEWDRNGEGRKAKSKEKRDIPFHILQFNSILHPIRFDLIRFVSFWYLCGSKIQHSRCVAHLLC